MGRGRLAVALGTVVIVLVFGQPTATGAEDPTSAPDPQAKPPGLTEPEVPGTVDGAAVLEQAQAAVEGELAVDGQGGPDPEVVADPSLALAGLYAAYDDLTRGQQAEASDLLARPNDGDDRDPVKYPAGATVERLCGAHACVQYITTGDHAPNLTDSDGDGTPDWVETTGAQLEAVWAREIGSLGYRAPASDGTRGGDGKLDVYLANVSAAGYFGYCAPETNVPGQRYRASGYCVLDDDYAGFAISPLDALRVTAAHEFFHAVQFNYDFAEDPWVMEATAAWMEERYADDVDDNRTYLRYSQLQSSTTPLDTGTGFAIYGGWVFFERLSRSFGVDAVRLIWGRLDASRGSGDAYSVQGIDRFLRARRTNLGKFYIGFASGNTHPRQAYAEGGAYPVPAPVRRARITNADPSKAGRVTLRHLSSAHIRFRPAPGLRRTWLRVDVDGPALTNPRARVRIHLANGTSRAKAVRLSRAGNGSTRVLFRRPGVTLVTLTLANASSRYACWQGTSLACQGRPLDNRSVFGYTATAR